MSPLAIALITLGVFMSVSAGSFLLLDWWQERRLQRAASYSRKR